MLIKMTMPPVCIKKSEYTATWVQQYTSELSSLLSSDENFKSIAKSIREDDPAKPRWRCEPVLEPTIRPDTVKVQFTYLYCLDGTQIEYEVKGEEWVY